MLTMRLPLLTTLCAYLFVSTAAAGEKVFLHFDTDTYVVGDTIWYAGYCLPDSFPPGLSSTASRVAYVELRSPEGIFLTMNRHTISHGTLQGYFPVGPRLEAGFYEIRAYTASMLNLHEPIRRDGSARWWLSDYLDMGSVVTDKLTIPNPGAVGKGLDKMNETTYAGITDYFRPEGESLINRFTYDPQTENLPSRQHSLLYAPNPRIYSRVLPIYDAPAADRPPGAARSMTLRPRMNRDRYPRREGKVDVRFYPEGGQLVRGTLSRLAFEVRDGDGRHALPTALWLRHAGGVSDTLRQALHRGRGYILTDSLFWAHYGSRSALCLDDGDTVLRFPLPEARSAGVGLYCQVHADTITARIQPVGLPASGLHHAIIAGGGMGMQTGVNELVVYDDAGRKLAGRLFFVNRHDREAHAASTAPRVDSLSPLQAVEFSVRVTDAGGRPLPGTRLSVAVRDDAEAGTTYSAGNLLTELLLCSEIRGFVERPEYYFESDDSLHREHLDRLLLVQGWRRYDWDLLTGLSRYRPLYQPEERIMVRGQLLPAMSPRVPEGTLLQLKIHYSDSLVYEAVDTLRPNGLFAFHVPQVYGKYPMSLTPYRNERDLHAGRPDFVQGRGFKWRIWKQRPIGPMPEAYDYYQCHDIDHTLPAPDTLPTALLSEVTVAQAPRARFDLRHPVVRYPLKEWLDFVNDALFPHFFLGNSEDNVNNQFLPELSRRMFMRAHNIRANFEYHMQVIEEIDEYTECYWTQNPTCLLVDSVIWDDFGTRESFYNWEHPTENYPMRYSEISFYCDLYDRSRYMDDGKKHGIPELHTMVVTDTLHRHMYRSPEAEWMQFYGFQQPVERYEPDYSRQPLPDPQHPDRRRTLYWSPALTTGDDGRATVRFYNNSTARGYTLDVNGLTPDGRICTLHLGSR